MTKAQLTGTLRGSGSVHGDLTAPDLSVLTPNQLVAYNLQQARTRRGPKV